MLCNLSAYRQIKMDINFLVVNYYVAYFLYDIQ